MSYKLADDEASVPVSIGVVGVEASKEVAASAPLLADVSGKVEKILVEQRMDTMLNELLQNLHAQAHIERMAPFVAQAPETHP